MNKERIGELAQDCADRYFHSRLRDRRPTLQACVRDTVRRAIREALEDAEALFPFGDHPIWYKHAHWQIERLRERLVGRARRPAAPSRAAQRATGGTKKRALG